MKKVSLIVIGKLGDKNYEQLEAEYKKRFKSFKFQIFELKGHQEDREKESKEIQKKLNDLGPCMPIFLTENGKHFDSPKFSQWFYNKLEQNNSIALIIGGAAGLDRELFKLGPQLSLSELTYPHKLARLVLIEQLYRAETIYQGHPYHK
jgi:23S rRNA (pseudouridine1915-N3)-methyltransferase